MMGAAMMPASRSRNDGVWRNGGPNGTNGPDGDAQGMMGMGMGVGWAGGPANTARKGIDNRNKEKTCRDAQEGGRGGQQVQGALAFRSVFRHCRGDGLRSGSLFQSSAAEIPRPSPARVRRRPQPEPAAATPARRRRPTPRARRPPAAGQAAAEAGTAPEKPAASPADGAAPKAEQAPGAAAANPAPPTAGAAPKTDDAAAKPDDRAG